MGLKDKVQIGLRNFSTPTNKASSHIEPAYGLVEEDFYKEEFEEYAEKAKTLPDAITTENNLILYGLYKQATAEIANASVPGMLDSTAKAKWNAWKAVAGKSKEEAMRDYITKVKQLLEEASASR